MSSLATPRGRWIRLRMGLMCGLMALAMGLIVSSAGTLMVEDGSMWRELAERQRQRRLHVLPKRGTIMDRSGSPLAVSVEVPSVSLDAVELLHGVPSSQVPVVARRAANEIARALSIDPAMVERRILQKRRFAWLKRQIGAAEAESVRSLGDRKARGSAAIGGLNIEGEGRRYYPRRELAAPLLGFVAPDGEGKEGFELALNTELQGHADSIQGLRDRSGRLLLSEGLTDDQALAGHDVVLTLDQGLQYVAERELSAAIKTFEAAGGSVIVVDPSTGELLAIASYPTFNPNDYSESEPIARRVRGVSDAFEPGSTMKMFTVAAGLASSAITPTQKLYCEKGQMAVDNVVIRDTHPAGWLSISQILAVSSNICAAKIGMTTGSDKLYESLQRFGFGQPTGLPVPGEASGTLRPRGRPWVQVETASAAFGQGISVSNLQLAMAAAALANGGELMEPLLVKRVLTSTGEVVQEAAPRVRRRVVSRQIAAAITEMMTAVTEGEGTGLEGAVSGYQVSGKTATAQKVDPATGRYSLDKYVSSFVGYLPAKQPVVTIAVMLDEPMVEHAGGAVAAPVFRRVAEYVLKARGMTPQGTARADLAEVGKQPDPANAAYDAWRRASGMAPAVQASVPAGPLGAGQRRLPDLTAWPVRAALKQVVELGFEPVVQGSGLLVRQQPPPGSALRPGAVVTLVFEPSS